MKLEKSMQLGELYRELRIARGLKLKDVARENLSVSQLSRFENGQSMLAADKLLIAISGIHMTFAEFGHAINNYQEPKLYHLVNKAAELYNKQDIEGLRGLLESDMETEVFDVYNRLTTLIIKTYIYTLDSTYTITEEEKNFLTSYLYEIEEWTEYELFIFGNTMSILSESDLIFLGKAFVDRDKVFLSIPSHKKNAEIVFLNLILLLISPFNLSINMSSFCSFGEYKLSMFLSIKLFAVELNFSFALFSLLFNTFVILPLYSFKYRIISY